MHQSRTQLFSVAFSLCLALGMTCGLSARAGHGEQGGWAVAAIMGGSGGGSGGNTGGGSSQSEDSKNQRSEKGNAAAAQDSADADVPSPMLSSDPIAMSSQVRTTDPRVSAIRKPATEPEPGSVVFGKGVWETGHAGLALPSRCDNRIGEPLIIPGIDMYPENRILIFNSQGQRVFTQRGYANGWTGLDREGKPLPQGKYFVIVEVDGLGDDVQSYMNLVH